MASAELRLLKHLVVARVVALDMQGQLGPHGGQADPAAGRLTPWAALQVGDVTAVLAACAVAKMVPVGSLNRETPISQPNLHPCAHCSS